MHYNKKYLASLLALTLCLQFTLASPTEAIEQLNRYRTLGSMLNYTTNSLLSRASRNHSNYLIKNNIAGHFEAQGHSGFTGVAPADRAVYVGFKTKSVSENISAGTHSADLSIDGLFSAIYHRFGFLSFENDLVGSGENDGTYTYLMSNNALNSLCGQNGTQSGWTVCATEGRNLSDKDYTKAIDDVQKSNPPFVVWPPNNMDDVYPVFFTESPHPLPGSSVSGFPVSISFNPYFAQSASVSKIEVYDDEDTKLSGKFMRKSNDPNRRFSDLEYAFFPLYRLKFATEYRVVIDYSFTPTDKFNGETSGTLNYSFITEVPEGKFYSTKELKDSNNIPIVANETYTFYVAPTSNKDLAFSSMRWSKTQGVRETIDQIDSNTVKITVSGSVGGSLTIETSSKKKFIFKISASDEAVTLSVTPSAVVENTEEVAPVNTEPSTQTLAINYTQGWNLLSLPISTVMKKNPSANEYDMDKIAPAGDIYVLQGGTFTDSPDSIQAGEGFWFKAKTAGKSNSVSGETYKLDSATIQKGWGLYGTGMTGRRSDLELGAKDTLFVFKNNTFIKDPVDVSAGDGFLIYRP